MLIWYTTSIASLPGVGITSKICLLTATLADKDNPSSDALLSDNSLDSQETFVEGRQVHSWMILSVMHVIWCGSIKALVVRCWYRLVNTLGLYVNTLEYTELLNGLILIGYMEVKHSLLYYVLLILIIWCIMWSDVCNSLKL